jgi:hypothetical protein
MKKLLREVEEHDKEARTVCLKSEVAQGDGRETKKAKYCRVQDFFFLILILGKNIYVYIYF